jgi:hypothetical protein
MKVGGQVGADVCLLQAWHHLKRFHGHQWYTHDWHHGKRWGISSCSVHLVICHLGADLATFQPTCSLCLSFTCWLLLLLSEICCCAACCADCSCSPRRVCSRSAKRPGEVEGFGDATSGWLLLLTLAGTHCQHSFCHTLCYCPSVGLCACGWRWSSPHESAQQSGNSCAGNSWCVM